MKGDKNYLYVIKNVKTSELILVYSVLDNNFILLYNCIFGINPLTISNSNIQ